MGTVYNIVSDNPQLHLFRIQTASTFSTENKSIDSGLTSATAVKMWQRRDVENVRSLKLES